MNIINKDALRKIDGIRNMSGSNYDVIVKIRVYLILHSE